MKSTSSTFARLNAFLLLFVMAGSVLGAQGVAKDMVGSSPWGVEDEIGTLNRMTESSRLNAIRKVAAGKVYDLAVDLFVGMPNCCSDTFGDPTFQMWMTHVPSREEGDLIAHSSDAISMSTHSGTHLDTLSHFGLHGKIWNQIDAKKAVSARGWLKSGAEKYPPIVSRGVLIDIPRSKNLEKLPASYSITVADIEKALSGQKLQIQPGDVVLIRTGMMTQWPDRAQMQLFQQAGLGLEAARWLVEKKVTLLGADNLGFESFPSGDGKNFAPVHSYLLAEQGMPFMELLWLEELSKDQVNEFLFIASPLKIRGATGAPVRPIAIPINSGS